MIKKILIKLDQLKIIKLNDEKYLKLLFESKMNYPLNLNNPKTYNEKLQWLKLYDRKDIYTTMVDKYEVKEYVSNIIGKEYIIPTIGIYDKFDDINFDKLPNQFVLKCTHDSGGIVICKDKNSFDIKSAKMIINNSLAKNFYYLSREWPYKNVKPRIIAEEYMEDKKSKSLDDYKFFCFNGVPKILFVATERQNKNLETCFDFYDMDFNHLPIKNGHPNSNKKIKKPEKFNEMKKLAGKLSKNIPHVRVDFYEINGRVYFGELTFYHWGGFVPFEPEKWDKELGDMLDLGMVKKNEK